MALAVAIAGMVAAAPAWGSSTVGVPVASLVAGSQNGCVAGIKCTYYQARGSITNLQAPAFTAPFDGTIVRWRVGAGSTANKLTLRVIRPAGTKFIGAGTGTQREITEAGVTTFEGERLPVKAGDTIGVDNEDSALFFAVPGLELAAVDFFKPFLPDSGPPQSPEATEYSPRKLELDADVVGLPTSSVLASSCPGASGALVAVTADPDPATRPKAVRFRVDGGAEQTVATTGSPGVAAVTVPAGVHQLELWGEDALGQQEASHHLISAGCPVAPAGGGAGGANQSASPLVLSNVGQSARRWRAGNALARFSARRVLAPLGTTFSFALNAAATATFTFTQRVTGRQVGTRCVAPSGANSHKPRCTRIVTRGAFSFGAHSGTNRMRFQGRLSPTKKLAPGSYALTIAAADASARRATPATLSFTIVAR